MRFTALILLAACGGSSPPPRGPAESTKPADAGPKDQSGGLGCEEPCPLTQAKPVEVDVAPAPAGPPIWDRIQVTPGPVPGLTAFTVDLVANPNHCGGKQLVTARTKKQVIAKADQPLADVFALEYPLGLDFTPDTEQARTSTRTFEAWIESTTKTFTASTEHYQADLSSTDPGVQVVAAARIHQISLRLASVLAYAEVPQNVRDTAETKAVFCATLADYASVMLARADEAKAACTEKAKLVDVRKPLWWSAICT